MFMYLLWMPLSYSWIKGNNLKGIGRETFRKVILTFDNFNCQPKLVSEIDQIYTKIQKGPTEGHQQA